MTTRGGVVARRETTTDLRSLVTWLAHGGRPITEERRSVAALGTTGPSSQPSRRSGHGQLERTGCGTATTITPVRVAPTSIRSPLVRKEARIGPTIGSRTGIVRTRW